MHHRCHPELGGDRQQEPDQRGSGFSHPVVQGAGRHGDPEQIGQRVRAAFPWEVLRAHQVQRMGFDRRAVTRRCGRVGWEDCCGHAPTGAPAPLGPVLGHNHGRVRDVEHLPGGGPHHVAVDQRPGTGPAPVRPMHDHLVGVGDLGQREPGCARLFALLADHRPASRPVRVLRPCRLRSARIARWGLGRVRRVASQQLLQVCHLARQRRHLLVQLRHPRPQRSVLHLELIDPGLPVHATVLPHPARSVVDIRALRAITPDWLRVVSRIETTRSRATLQSSSVTAETGKERKRP